jgi:hypothetical protein
MKILLCLLIAAALALFVFFSWRRRKAIHAKRGLGGNPLKQTTEDTRADDLIWQLGKRDGRSEIPLDLPKRQFLYNLTFGLLAPFAVWQIKRASEELKQAAGTGANPADEGAASQLKKAEPPPPHADGHLDDHTDESHWDDRGTHHDHNDSHIEHTDVTFQENVHVDDGTGENHEDYEYNHWDRADVHWDGHDDFTTGGWPHGDTPHNDSHVDDWDC